MLKSKSWGSALLALAAAGTLSLAACGDNTGPTVALQAINLEPSSGTVHAASTDTVPFTAVPTYSDGTHLPALTGVTWSSADTDSVTITQDGVASPADGVQPDTDGIDVVITATVGDISGSGSVHVIQSSEVTEVQVTPATSTIAVGFTETYTATAIYADGRNQNATDAVTWSVSPGAAGTFDANVITAEEAGDATVTATLGTASGDASLTITDAVPVGLTIEPAAAVIAAGTTLQYAAVAELSDGSFTDVTDSPDITWGTDDSAIADISDTGLALGNAEGDTNVTADFLDQSATAALTVTTPDVVSVAVTPPAATVLQGASTPLTATATYSDDSTSDVTLLATWVSANAAIVAVSASGNVTGVAMTTTPINVTATFSGQSGSAAITVSGARVESVQVTPAAPAPLAKGRTQQFQATAFLADGTTQPVTNDANLTFTSTVATACSISNAAGSKGLATAVSSPVGASAIGATYITPDGRTLMSPTVPLSCTDAQLTAIAVTPPTASTPAGFTVQYTATGTFSDGTTSDVTGAANWTSSMTGFGTVSNAVGSKGLATGVAPGTTTLTAAMTTPSGTVSGTATLIVSNVTLAAIQVLPNPAVVAKGATQQFTATGVFSDSSTRDLTNDSRLTWSIDDPCPGGTVDPCPRATISNAAGSKGLAHANGFTDPFNEDDAITVAADFATTAIEGTGLMFVLTNVVIFQNCVVGNHYSGSFGGLTGVPEITYGFNLDGFGDFFFNFFGSGWGPIPVGGTAQAYAFCEFEDERIENCSDAVTFGTTTPLLVSVSNAAGSLGLVTGLAPGATATLNCTSLGGIGAFGQDFQVTNCDTSQVRVSNPGHFPGTFDQYLEAPNASDIETCADDEDPPGCVEGDETSPFDVFAGATTQYHALASFDDDGTCIGVGSGDCFGSFARDNCYDATTQSTWSTGNSAVATVSNAAASKGLITGANMPPDPNAAQIQAVYHGQTDGGGVRVIDACLESLTITPVDPTLPFVVDFDPDPGAPSPSTSAGIRVQFTATGSFSNGTTADISDLVGWFSDDEDVLGNVDDLGKFETVGVGVTTVTASIGVGDIFTCSGETVSDDTSVTVVDRDVNSLTVTPVSPTISRGEDIQLHALATFSDGTQFEVTDAPGAGTILADTFWTSANTTVATVDAAGLVTGDDVNMGTSFVSAGYAGVTGGTTVTVSGRTLIGIVISAEEDDEVFNCNPALPGGPYPRNINVPLHATGTYEDGTIDSSGNDITAQVHWISSATGVATVTDGTGIAHTGNAGTTLITATLSGVTSDQDGGMAGNQPFSFTVYTSVLNSIDVADQNGDEGNDPPGTEDGDLWEMHEGTSDQFHANGNYTLTAPGGGTSSIACEITTVVGWQASPATRLTINAATGRATALLVPGAANVTATLGLVNDVSNGVITPECIVGITATPVSISTQAGVSVDVDVVANFSDGSTDGSIPFDLDSSDTDVFTIDPGPVVDSTYTIVGTGAGTGTATFSLDPAINGCPGLPVGGGDFEDTIDVTVGDAVLERIEIHCPPDPDSLFGGNEITDFGNGVPAIPVGVDLLCSAEGFYSDGSNDNSQSFTDSVTWSPGVAMPPVVTVNDSTAKGRVTSLRVGQTDIAATLGPISGGFHLVVNNATLIDPDGPGMANPQGFIEVCPEGDDFPCDPLSLPVGFTVQYTATGHYALPGGIPPAGIDYDLTRVATWDSSAPTVASVGNSATDKGLARTLAVNAMPAQIRATYQTHTGSANLTVNAGALASIDVQSDLSLIAVGQHLQYHAIGTFDDLAASQKEITDDVTWVSSNGGIASIDAGGLAAGVSGDSPPLTVTITASLAGLTGTSSLSVTDACIDSLELTPPSVTVPADVPLIYTATAILSDGTPVDVTEQVDFDSSSGDVPTPDEDGYTFTTSDADPGTVTISADATDTEFTVCDGADATATATVTITAATLSSIEVIPANGQVSRGNTLQYTATGTYTDGTHHDITQRCTWVTGNLFTADVVGGPDDLDSGLVTGNSNGTTTVSATQGLVSAVANVTVTDAVLDEIQVRGYVARTGTADVAANNCRLPTNTSRFAAGGAYTDPDDLNESNFVMPDGGTTTYVRAIGIYSAGPERDITNDVAWTSSDNLLAQVGTDGKVRVVYTNTGTLTDKTVNIIATQGTESDSLTLTIRDLFLGDIEINRGPAEPDPLLVALDGTGDLQAQGRFGTVSMSLQPSDFFFCINEDATWSSVNAGIASVSNVSGERGTVTGEGIGTTQVTAAIGAVNDIINVTCSNAEVASIVVLPATNTLTFADQGQMQALATLTDGNVVDITGDPDTTWPDAGLDFTSISPDGVVSNPQGDEGTDSIDACNNGNVVGDIVCASDDGGEASLTWVSDIP